VVCSWLGNSPRVANRHYLQVTDTHFEKALQNPVQQLHGNSRNVSQDQKGQKTKPAFFNALIG
jgi:hypothetical protein